VLPVVSWYVSAYTANSHLVLVDPCALLQVLWTGSSSATQNTWQQGAFFARGWLEKEADKRTSESTPVGKRWDLSLSLGPLANLYCCRRRRRHDTLFLGLCWILCHVTANVLFSAAWSLGGAVLCHEANGWHHARRVLGVCLIPVAHTPVPSAPFVVWDVWSGCVVSVCVVGVAG